MLLDVWQPQKVPMDQVDLRPICRTWQFHQNRSIKVGMIRYQLRTLQAKS